MGTDLLNTNFLSRNLLVDCVHEFDFLVSTYVVYERLSVMHKQARLPEIFSLLVKGSFKLTFFAIVTVDIAKNG